MYESLVIMLLSGAFCYAAGMEIEIEPKRHKKPLISTTSTNIQEDIYEDKEYLYVELAIPAIEEIGFQFLEADLLQIAGKKSKRPKKKYNYFIQGINRDDFSKLIELPGPVTTDKPKISKDGNNCLVIIKMRKAGPMKKMDSENPTTAIIDEDIYADNNNNNLFVELAIPNVTNVKATLTSNLTLLINAKRKDRTQSSTKRYLLTNIDRRDISKIIKLPFAVKDEEPAISIKNCMVSIKMKKQP